MTESTIFERPPGVLIREVDGELLLLNTRTESYFGLNPSGAAMFNALVDGCSTTQAIERVNAEFDVARSIVQSDLLQLLDALLAKGLIVVREV